MPKLDVIASLKSAKKAGTPICAINTPDQPALAAKIVEKLNGGAAMFAWDYVRGLYARNEPAKLALAAITNEDEIAVREPIEALNFAHKLPPGSVLIYFNAQRFVGDAGVCQSLLNLRDEWKAENSIVVLVGHQITLPSEIATDVVQWSEELPDDEKLVEIVSEQVALVSDQFTKAPSGESVKRAAIALRGTSAFGAEQLAAMSLRKDGIDLDTLHTQAKALIEQTPGLTFERGSETFDDIGGLDFAKEFGKRIFSGPRAPAVIVRVEELEKSMAGARGDLSGTSGDALQVLLSEMEDNNWSGLLAYGAPGAGKSIYAKSLANSYNAKAVRFDLNACKGSLVGQSEKQIRQAMNVIKTIGGDRVFFVASCNRMENLPPELQRRFRSGVWFFDIPDATERARIWAINLAKYGITEKPLDEADLTGADIRNICEQSYALACSLAEARRYVVPLKVQSPADIEAARKIATGKFTDASRGGVYDRSKPTVAAGKAAGRKVQVGA